MSIAKNIMKEYKNNVIEIQQKAEDLCNDYIVLQSIETGVYYFDDGSLLWFDSKGKFGDTNLWFVFDANNGIISRGFQNHDQAVDELLEYVEEYGAECIGFFGIVDLFGEEEVYNG